MHITLYRKYRPKSFEELSGEKNIVKAIKNSIKQDRLSHAYLFAGPRGVGKTTSARLIAKSVNCEEGMSETPCNKCKNCLSIDKGNFFDLIEIDAASNRGIDEIRELKDKVAYQASVGRKKIYIIDEVHMLTKEAFNALLKTLEEPPSHVIFILATTEPDKIPDTIISRCQRYDFSILSYEDVRDKLFYIAEKEEVKIAEESLKLIYKKSGGSLRDAISIFEKVVSSYYLEEIDLNKTEEALGVSSSETITKFLDCIYEKNINKAMEEIENLWKEGTNIEAFFKDLAYYLKELILKKENKLSLKESLDIIEIIFDVNSKFRYEEDKSLIAYIILNRIFVEKEKRQTTIIAKEKISEKNELVTEDNTDLLTIIKKDWKDILNKAKEEKISLLAFLSMAKPIKMENKILTIGFPKENNYHKTSMEKKENRDFLVNILREKLNEKDVELNFEIIGRQNKEPGKKDDKLLEQLIDFFDGEIIT